MTSKTWLWSAVVALSLLVAGQAWSARESNVRATKHNFSNAVDGSAVPGRPTTTVPARTVKATSETQVCVFCHTPHAATSGATPLWNRRLSAATYTPYSSNSLDANHIGGVLAAPGGSSKLCLSCHDGTLAIGNVNVLNGVGSATTPGTVSIGMTGTGTGGVMPPGSGTTTGFTRFLDANLTNDHPISVTYNAALANRDGELRVVDGSQRWPATTGATIGVRTSGYKPKLPLEPTGAGNAGQVQCATCHDPHIRETNEATVGNQKFLRLNRFQEAQPTGTYVEATDTICLSCHDKGGISWAYSAHANQSVATQTYIPAAATQREFPTNLFPVWKAACLNCHDTHTVPGARRLLREGTNSTASPKSSGNPAIEQTCYQCHSASGTSIITPVTSVPDIMTDYTTAGNKSMPITDLAQQLTGTEKHDIGGNFNDVSAFILNIDCSTTATNKCGADFIESRALLGVNNLANRHAECTDCHNPHRVVKFKDFRGRTLGNLTTTPDASGTHKHTDDFTDIHTNIASGVLRGSWGVEPTYSSDSFQDLPSGYIVKRGDPGTNTSALSTDSYVTREYQICLKCHSDYAYSDTGNVYPNSTTRPQLGGGTKTAANANGHTNFTSYTNQAKEFQAPSLHAIPVGSQSRGTLAGAGAGWNANNHRSWHPVMKATGRTGRLGAWLAPWNNTGTGGLAGRLGVQTMYCSDCHGSSTGTTASVIPTGGENGSPWGPHGSINNFLLKGEWDTGSGEGNANTLCFKCHSQAAYSGGGGTGWNTDKGDGHEVHSQRIDNPLRCNWCHVAVPHGWKNRGLLVNLNDVGPEAGLTAGTNVWVQATMNNNLGGYSNGPYYRRAYLRVTSFPAGQWSDTDCNGGRSGMKNNCETQN